MPDLKLKTYGTYLVRDSVIQRPSRYISVLQSIGKQRAIGGNGIFIVRRCDGGRGEDVYDSKVLS